MQTAAATAPPQIIGQPQNRIVAPGEAASFSVVAAHTRALTYQWRFNGTNISGATNDAVLLQNVSTNHEGEYRVVLTNPSGSVTSAPAFLMIDSDADGVADSWELTHFGNLTNSATADFDGDGSSNLQEFLDGTNPGNTNSVRYHLVVAAGGGTVIKTPDKPSYDRGETVTLTLTTSSNELFHAWLGDVVTRDNPLTLVMTNNKSVYACFTPIVFQWGLNFSGGDWETAANWIPKLVPGLDDIVLIRKGGAIALNTPAVCREFTLGGDGDATLTGSGTLTVRENLFWNAGMMSGSGRTVVETNAALYISGFVNLTGRTLENGGTVVWSGNGIITLNSDAVITNRAGALFNAQNAVALQSGTAGRFDNAGIFRKSVSAGITTVGGISFNNSGAVEIQSGTLVLAGGFNNSGAVSLSSGATNRLAGGGVNDGTFTAAATAVVEWIGGTFNFGPGASLNGAGIYRLNGGNVTSTADLTLENLDLISTFSTLSGAGAVTIINGMNWTAGTMSGGGRTIIAPGATLNAANPSQVILATRTLENGGTVNWTGAGNIHLGSSSITNRAGALFHAQNAAPIFFGGGVCRFDNAGTFRKSASIGTTTVVGGVSFNNSGSVEIQSGTLVFGGGFTNNGTVNLSPGATNRLAAGGVSDGPFIAAATAVVEWIGGTFTLNPGAPLNGAGVYRLNGGNVTVAADLTVENLDLVSAVSTLAGSGAVTIASGLNWTAGVMSGGGRTIIAPAAILNAAPPSLITLSSRTLENGGTVLWTGAGNIGLSAASITNRAGAMFHAQNATQISFGGGVCRFDNAGTFRKSASAGTTTVAGGISFNNSGAVEIQSGTLVFNGGCTNLGIVSLSPGATNRLVGGGMSDGAFTAAATAVVEWTGGTFTLNPGAQLNGAGLYRLNGGSVTATADLTVENLDLVSGSSTLGGAGAATIASRLNWTAGIMIGSGKTIIQLGATLNLAVTNAVALNSRTLENAGTILWTGPGLVQISSAVITNRAGALFEAQNAAAFVASGLDRFDNAGTFRKSVSTGATFVQSGMSFNNYGTVDLRSGILAANGGYTSTSNAQLNCALGGTTAGTGHGQLQVAGTVSLKGALSVDLLPGFTLATNNTFAVVTAGIRSGTFTSFTYPSNAVTMQLSNTASSVIVRVTDVFATIPPPMLSPPSSVGTNFLLIWTAISNTTYRVEFSPGLENLTNWNPLSGDITATSNTATKFDPLTSSNRFYRVRVVP